MTFRLWPQSLFGRLMAASIIALLLAQVVSLVIIARERERFILQGSVREWSRRIAEVTTVLQGMDDTERSAMITRLTERPWRFGHRPPDAYMLRDGLVNGPEGDPAPFPAPGGHGGRMGYHEPQGDRGAPGAVPPTAKRPGALGTAMDAPREVPPTARRPGALGPATDVPREVSPTAKRPMGPASALDAPREVPPTAKRPLGPEPAFDAPREVPPTAKRPLGPEPAFDAPPEVSPTGKRLLGPELAPDAPREVSKLSQTSPSAGGPGLGEPLAPPDVPPEAAHSGQASVRAGPAIDDPQGRHDLQGRRLGPLGAPPEDNRSLVLRATTYPAVVPFTKAGDFEPAFEDELRKDLGPGFETEITRTADPTKKAIPIGGPLFNEARDSGADFYDAKVKFPDGYAVVFRVTRYSRGAPLPRGLFMNLAFLVIVMSIALWVVARSITRPLSDLARAADSVGRDLRQPKLAERGAREIRNAARAFNTMQDRMQRYLDSRSRVLAAMSHDLKTPLTRLRLQVEMLDDSAAQVKLGRQLDEMESMVHGALALFRGLDDNEAFTPIDVNEMLATLQSEFAEMSAQVSIQGQATRSILAKPQALRRCLTNLIANAIKFGSQATVIVEDGASLVIRIRDEGPGIPDEELERVFEPFYRLESSRNRDTGGSGLGLSIARDVIQAHGGSLILRNLPVRGLEAMVSLPRA
jgi:signal transduction histidine kinase